MRRATLALLVISFLSLSIGCAASKGVAGSQLPRSGAERVGEHSFMRSGLSTGIQDPWTISVRESRGQ